MKFLNTLILFVLFTLLSFSQEYTKTLKSDKIDSLLSFFPENEPGGSFLVANKGKVIYKKAFGKANLELDVPMKSNYVMGIASVTKPFTAMAILKLAEEGKISLDNPLSMYIKDFPNGTTILVKHLVAHTSGLPYFSLEERAELESLIVKLKNDDTQLISNHFKNKEFKNRPGETYAYSNEAYILLGYIVKKVTGEEYNEYLESIFFTPLNMESTQLESFKKVIKNRATGYDSFDDAAYQIKQQGEDDISFYSAGGLMSSVDDLFTWYKAIFNYEILNQSSINNALKPITYNNGTIGKNGLGWFLGNLNMNPYIIHDGLSWGYGAVVVYFPKEDLFIAHIRNCGYCKYDRGLSYQAPLKIASILLDSEFTTIKNNYNFEEFTGIYVSSKSENKNIISEGNQLFIKDTDNYTPLNFIKENIYFSEKSNETFIFTANGLDVLGGASLSFKKSKESPKKSLNLFLENELYHISKENLISICLNKIQRENYEVNENSINQLGYTLIQNGDLELAIEIFKLNTKLFPNSANTFDSLGESYFQKEDYANALKNYELALKLNPKSNTAELMIRKLKENYLE